MSTPSLKRLVDLARALITSTCVHAQTSRHTLSAERIATTILNGQPIFIFGAQGNRPKGRDRGRRLSYTGRAVHHSLGA